MVFAVFARAAMMSARRATRCLVIFVNRRAGIGKRGGADPVPLGETEWAYAKLA
jgi:hypothetical protein